MTGRLGRIADALVVVGEGRRTLLALVAGALTALALPPVGLWPVAFATFPLLVFLVEGAQNRRGGTILPAFRTGWAFGFGYHLAGLYWIGAAFLVDADEFAWLLPLAVTVLPAGLALFTGLAVALARAAWSEGWTRVMAMAAMLAASEWLRGHVLTGFPWNLFGTIVVANDVTMGWVALWGAYGVTFGALVAFCAPALLARAHGRRGDGIFAFAFALAVAGHAGWLVLREPLPSGGGGTPVRIVQPAVPQADKWKPENAAPIVQSLLDLSSATTSPQTAGLQPGTLLVWPESVFPFLVAEEPSVLSAIADLLPERSALVAGAMRSEPPAVGEDGTFVEGRVWNAVLAFDTQGRIAASQDKTHLVPFGEYLPFQETLERVGLRQLTQLRGGFATGAGRRPLDLAALVPGLPPFVALICYEIVFPGDAVPGTGARPGFLLNVTNDGWFGATSGPHQHALQSRLRGVEEGLPVLRAANDGISFVADAHGRVIASLGRGQRGTLDAVLPHARADTLYARWGDWPLGLALLVAIVAVLLARRGHAALR